MININYICLLPVASFESGRVISTLTEGKKGAIPPFRESKLTLLLKEALSGIPK